jgi:hypothetical protein
LHRARLALRDALDTPVIHQNRAQS